MKTGKQSIQEFAEAVNQLAVNRNDYVVDSRGLAVHTREGVSRIDLREVDDCPLPMRFNVNDWALNQVLEDWRMPKEYAHRLRASAPGLFDGEVNHWFAAEPKKRMIRTVGDIARAVVSDSYLPMDHDELIEVILPDLLMTPGLRIESCDVTERRLYIKAVKTDSRAEFEVPGYARGQNHTFVNEVLQAGVEIGNSEVGDGGLYAYPFTLRLVCLNGATRRDLGTRKVHAGRRQDVGDQAWVSREARQKSKEARLLEFRDAVRYALSDEILTRQVNDIQAAAGIQIADPGETVDRVARKFTLSEPSKDGILRYLVEGGDPSLWGLANAITRASQDEPSYDEATRMEEIGGDLIAMPTLSRQEFRELVPVRVSRK